jgi:hypothetical protein
MSEHIHIEGTEASATSPEGQTATLSLETLLARIAPPRMDTCGAILPDGIKMILSRGAHTIWVHESPPRVHNFRWIAGDSPSPFGRGTKYRPVRIALPYLVLLAVFGPGPGGRQQLTGANECFFRNAPLKDPADALLFPALLNCSRFAPEAGRPLSWICTQHLDFITLLREEDQARRLVASFNALRHCLLETGFNFSSEHHAGEAGSWYSASRGVDPRINTVEAWQEASALDPLFVLDVPWLPTGRSLAEVAERSFQNLGANRINYASAAAWSRVIFNQTAAPRPRHRLIQELLDELTQ